MSNKINKDEVKAIAEGIAFTYTKKCPFLSEKEINILKEVVEGYLEEGVKYDPSFVEWQTCLEWVK